MIHGYRPRADLPPALSAWRCCWRCGIDFDTTPFTTDAPCLDCQEVIGDGDVTPWARRTVIRRRSGRAVYITYITRAAAVRTQAEYAQLERDTLRLHRLGLTAMEIGWELDTSDTWVRRRLNRLGLEPNSQMTRVASTIVAAA